MCGFVAIYSAESDAIDESILEKMRQKIIHRGPDDHGIYFSHQVGLAHNRLSILDLSKLGQQPLVSVDKKKWIVFNGEIFNFLEIKNELVNLGHSFISRGDTEVLLKAYEVWGEEVLKKLNGMFSFVIWDEEKRKFFCARDRMGEKPFYYYHAHGIFIAASEIKAILAHPKVKKEICSEGFQLYMGLGFIPSPLTIFKNIYKLPPAHKVTVDQNQNLNIQSYWEIKNIPTKLSYEECKEKTAFLLRQSVKRRLLSDAPIGILLSGGIDSTLIAALSKEFSTEPINTFTSSFEVGARSFKYNQDADVADQTGKFFSSNHHRFSIGSDCDLLSSVKEAIYHRDEPNFVATNIAQLLICRYIKKTGVKVLLGGDGSDEIFGGYNRYQYDKWLDQLSLIPKKLRKGCLKLPLKKFKSLNTALEKSLLNPMSPDRFLTWWGIFSPEECRQYLNISYSRPEEMLVSELVKNKQFISQQDAQLYFDQKWWLAESLCMSSDTMSKASSVELRSPFLDHELVEFAMTVPFSMKAKTPKKLLKDSFPTRLLPDYVRNREKTGWFAPVHYWVKDFLWEDIVMKIKALPKTGLFNQSVTTLIDQPPLNNAQQIWNLYIFALWYDMYIGKLDA